MNNTIEAGKDLLIADVTIPLYIKVILIFAIISLLLITYMYYRLLSNFKKLKTIPATHPSPLSNTEEPNLEKDSSAKQEAQPKSIRFKMVTVLVSNISGFTNDMEPNDAKQFVNDLDKFYLHFNETVNELNIKKIKTLGDTYICAGGIQKKNRTNPIEVVLAAIEMQNYVKKLKSYSTEGIWNLKFGIHTGPVFVKAESFKKQKYEISGDTVTVATRVESTCENGKICISGGTYELIRDYFHCQYYGKLPVKYYENTDLFIIEGFRPILSVDGKGLKANSAFYTKLAGVRFYDLEEEILNKIEYELPLNMYYHNLKHTMDVINQTEIIAKRENVTDEEMLLLKTAALFHDTGFMKGYDNHERLGTEVAREILPNYGYDQNQIDKICDLIMVTKFPVKPTNLLEMIICDADLDYLGRADFVPVSNNLFRELVENNIMENNIEKWNDLQINFIEHHQYFTNSAKELREVNKNKQLENIRNLANK